MPSKTPNHGFDVGYQQGESWDYNQEFSKLDSLIPHELHSDTIIHTTGSSTTVRTSALTADQQAMFEVVPRMNEAVSANLAYNTDVSKFWDEANQWWSADITFNWDVDPGVDVEFLVSVQERSLTE